jgi:hypothetical protein
MTDNNPLSDFINLSNQLLDSINIVSENIQIKNYCKICKKFVEKYPLKYVNMYKSYIYVKSKDIKNNEYSIVNDYKKWNLNDPNINIKKDDIDNIFQLLFTSFDSLSEENKKAIFTYLQYMNEILDKYNL